MKKNKRVYKRRLKYFHEDADGSGVYVCTDKKITTVEEAFAKTLEKWYLLKSSSLGGYTISENASDSCGLCNYFLSFNEYNDPRCGKCPVKVQTKNDGCRNFIAYNEWEDCVASFSKKRKLAKKLAVQVYKDLLKFRRIWRKKIKKIIFKGK